MQTGDYSRPLAVSRHVGVAVRRPNEKKRPFNFALPKHRPDAGIEALSVQLPMLVVSPGAHIVHTPASNYLKALNSRSNPSWANLSQLKHASFDFRS
jgi:hypothetical protein